MSAFKLPLRIARDLGDSVQRIQDAHKVIIGSGNYLTPEQAAEIVEAVNSHAALLEAARALKRIKDWVEIPAPRCLEEDRAFLVNTAYREARAALESLEKAGVKL